MCKNPAKIGIYPKINIWLAVINWWKMNKKVEININKFTIIRWFSDLLDLFRIFFRVININNMENIWINLKFPMSLLIFSWSDKLVKAKLSFNILPLPIVRGNKIYWKIKSLTGVLVIAKNSKNKIEIVKMPKIKDLKFLIFFLDIK